MSRPRFIPVLETMSELRRFEKALEKQDERKRITMLRLLKKNPSLTLKEVAAALGVTHHATKRWWGWYAKGGVARLLQGTGVQIAADDDGTLQALQDNIASGTFRTVGQVMQWLGVDPPRTKRGSEAMGQGGHPFTGKVIEFLTSIPSTHDAKIWMQHFQSALTQLFWDIDRVSITLNVTCDLASPESYQPRASALQHINDVKVPISVDLIEEDHVERLLNNFRQQGFPFDKYHPPVSFTYYYRESAYLGIVILWRERSQRPIARETLDAIEQLRPFFIYLFTDVVVRVHYMEPVPSASRKVLDRITNEYGLTQQQHRVLALHIIGATPEIIAESMSISVHTVRSHIKTIYRKTGVHSAHDLFVQYFVSSF